MMDITINFGRVALRQTGPAGLPFTVRVWDGEEWVPWEEGTEDQHLMIRGMIRGNPLVKTMTDWMHQVVFDAPK